MWSGSDTAARSRGVQRRLCAEEGVGDKRHARADARCARADLGAGQIVGVRRREQAPTTRPRSATGRQQSADQRTDVLTDQRMAGQAERRDGPSQMLGLRLQARTAASPGGPTRRAPADRRRSPCSRPTGQGRGDAPPQKRAGPESVHEHDRRPAAADPLGMQSACPDRDAKMFDVHGSEIWRPARRHGCSQPDSHVRSLWGAADTHSGTCPDGGTKPRGTDGRT